MNFKVAEPVIVRRPITGRSNEILTGNVIRATATHVTVDIADEGHKQFPVAQVTKASASEVNSFFSQNEEIIHNCLPRR